eukprot:11622343-Ditylum_brightwellii.AAC.1
MKISEYCIQFLVANQADYIADNPTEKHSYGAQGLEESDTEIFGSKTNLGVNDFSGFLDEDSDAQTLLITTGLPLIRGAHIIGAKLEHGG